MPFINCRDAADVARALVVLTENCADIDAFKRLLKRLPGHDYRPDTGGSDVDWPVATSDEGLDEAALAQAAVDHGLTRELQAWLDALWQCHRRFRLRSEQVSTRPGLQALVTLCRHEPDTLPTLAHWCGLLRITHTDVALDPLVAAHGWCRGTLAVMNVLLANQAARAQEYGFFGREGSPVDLAQRNKKDKALKDALAADPHQSAQAAVDALALTELQAPRADAEWLRVCTAMLRGLAKSSPEAVVQSIEAGERQAFVDNALETVREELTIGFAPDELPWDKKDPLPALERMNAIVADEAALQRAIDVDGVWLSWVFISRGKKGVSVVKSASVKKLAKLALQTEQGRRELRRFVLRCIRRVEQGAEQVYSGEQPLAADAALSLALAGVEDVPLFCRHLRTVDLNHEVRESRDIRAVWQAHGWRRETLALLALRLAQPGQHGETDVAYARKKLGLDDFMGKPAVDAEPWASFVRFLAGEYENRSHVEYDGILPLCPWQMPGEVQQALLEQIAEQCENTAPFGHDACDEIEPAPRLIIQPVRRTESPAPLWTRTCRRWYRSAEASADGRRVLLGGGDAAAALELVDAATGELLCSDGAMPQDFETCVADTELRRAAGIYCDRQRRHFTLQMIDLATRQPLWSVELDGATRRLAANADASLLAIGTDRFHDTEGLVRLIDGTDGKQLYEWQVYEDEGVGALTFSPDGSLLAVGSDDDDESLKILDVASREVVSEIPAVWCNCLRFAPDGRHLLRGRTQFHFYDWRGDTPLWRVTQDGGLGWCNDAAFSSDGTLALLATRPDAVNIDLAIHEVSSGRRLAAHRLHKDTIFAIAVAGDKLITASRDNTACGWSIEELLRKPAVRG